MFPFCSFLLLVLLHVELLEVLGDDGDGQRHDEDPRDGAQGPDELPEPGGGVDVSVAHCGHGDHHPVERVGDGGVLRVLLLPLDEVAERGEEQARDTDEEDQQTELLVTVLQGKGYGLKSSRVSCQFENASKFENSEYLENVIKTTPVICFMCDNLTMRKCEEDGDIKWKNGQ